MAKIILPQFNDLLEKAAKFVETQKGVWNHEEWLGFLSKIQKMGYEMSDSLQEYLGNVLESMRKYYKVAASAEGMKNALEEIADKTATFVQKTKGSWDHAGWENYLNDLQKKGKTFSDEATRVAGEMLEAARKLYQFPPIASSTQAPAAQEEAETEEAETEKKEKESAAKNTRSSKGSAKGTSAKSSAMEKSDSDT